jgi:hypothetical protein
MRNSGGARRSAALLDRTILGLETYVALTLAMQART